MNDIEIEAKIRKNYSVRNRLLAGAIEDRARRMGAPPLRERGKCAICHRQEHGGGLFTFRQRDGQTLLLGGRCALYLDYLIAHPGKASELLGKIA